MNPLDSCAWIVTSVKPTGEHYYPHAIEGRNLYVPIGGRGETFSWRTRMDDPRFFVCRNPHIALALHQASHAMHAAFCTVVDGDWKAIS